jgi:ABC-type uncharacterized transport system substrate-binding protein
MPATILLLALAALVLPNTQPAEAQQPKKVFRIGYLSSSDPTSEFTRVEAIRQALRERGYIEGQNIAIEYRYSEGKQDRQPELAAELVRLKADIIVVAGGDTVIRSAQNATKTIPIVLTGSGSDPVKAGFVESLARPGGNVTGLTNLSRELGGKRLELLKEAVPKLARVAVLYDPTIPGTTREVKEDLLVPARALGLTIRSWEVRDKDGFDRVFAALNKERPDGLYAPGGGRPANEKRIPGFALKNRTVGVRHQSICRCGRAHVLRGGPRGQLPARGILRGQNPEGSQARRPACRATDEVRVRDQFENCEANRLDYSAGGARPCE